CSRDGNYDFDYW
nr:immunoglobulin heavy chain junction region [Mus musculus]